MTFSIVIPTYNGERYIEEALLSAINQTRPADEIIISDDNSSDNTLSICEKYADRIKIYKNENGPSGFVNGWNKGIARCTCEYISILHQDDLLASTFLEEAENALKRYPECKHFFVPCNYIDANGKITKAPNYCTDQCIVYSEEEYISAYINIGTPHIHRCPGVITHKDIFNTCAYRKEAGMIADDDFFFRVGRYTPVLGLMKPLSSYRLHKESESGHLSSAKMESTLTSDYIFQLKESQTKKKLSNALLNYIINGTKRHSFREYIWCFRNKDDEMHKESCTHRKKMRKLGIKWSFKRRTLAFILDILGFKLSSSLAQKIF